MHYVEFQESGGGHRECVCVADKKISRATPRGPRANESAKGTERGVHGVEENQENVTHGSEGDRFFQKEGVARCGGNHQEVGK